jgi:hypothetical protein
MAWYNPSSWFNQTEQQSLDLYCMNPQCEDPIIKGERCAYEQKLQEIYHPGGCQSFALAWKMMEIVRGSAVDPLNPPVLEGNFRYISRQRAEKLVRNGKIRQPANLEQKVNESS